MFVGFWFSRICERCREIVNTIVATQAKNRQLPIEWHWTECWMITRHDLQQVISSWPTELHLKDTLALTVHHCRERYTYYDSLKNNNNRISHPVYRNGQTESHLGDWVITQMRSQESFYSHCFSLASVSGRFKGQPRFCSRRSLKRISE